VVRATSEALKKNEVTDVEQVLVGCIPFQVRSMDLEPMMRRARHVALTQLLAQLFWSDRAYQETEEYI
jgi:hypothetical protein